MEQKKTMRDKNMIAKIVAENAQRLLTFSAEHNPITGEGCLGGRTILHLEDYQFPMQLIPIEMLRNSPLITELKSCGSISSFIKTHKWKGTPPTVERVSELIRSLREKYDFQYWAFTQIKMKGKGIHGSIQVPLKFDYAQMVVLRELENRRMMSLPINVIVCNGSQTDVRTLSVFYQLWIALEWNPLYSFTICVEDEIAKSEVVGMLNTAFQHYNAKSLEVKGKLKMSLIPKTSEYVLRDTEGGQGSQVRHNRIRIGSAQEPDNLRGLPGSGVHLSEVAVWPVAKMYVEGLIKSMVGGILPNAYTVQIIETRPGDNDDYVHRAWVDAKNGDSEYTSLFLPWFYNQRKSLPIADMKNFALALLSRRDDKECRSEFEDSGKDLWRLWKLGATLESLLWYIYKRKEFRTTGEMRSYFPSESPYRRTWV